MKDEEDAFEIKLLYLGYPGVDGEITDLVQEKRDKRTILLLDAFDEDAQAS